MRHNRRRTALTMLGMAWGIATVVMLLAYGDGFGQACAEHLCQFRHQAGHRGAGPHLHEAGGQKAGSAVRFTLDDVDMLTTNLPQITAHHARSQQDSAHPVRHQNLRLSRSPATIPMCLPSVSLKLGQGRFYNAEDEIQHARVAVIGSEAKEKLFSGRNALGEHIRVDGLSFEVIGVLSPKMQEGNSDINRTLYVPFTTMGDLKDTHYLDSIWFTYATPEYERLEQSVRSLMAVQHKFNQTDRQAVLSVQPHDPGAPVRNHYAGT